ncbi:MAG: hypothetical protein WC764_04240 [Candidatus Paceibacterota bacterium]
MPSLKANGLFLNPKRLANRIANDKVFRKGLAISSLYWFAHIYYAPYIQYETADFQREIYDDLQDSDNQFLEILGFRGCTKSTIITHFFIVWSIITGRSRYPLLIADTDKQANRYLYNIRAELEQNELLIQDFGAFKPEMGADNDEWQKTTIVLPKYRARISAHSNGGNIRGLRHLEIRPDLVVCDDIENIEETRQKEQRDKLYRWFKSDVMQVGDRKTRYILLGNLLHSDGLMCRIEREIADGKIKGLFKRYPIIDEEGKSIWTGKFSNMESLDIERRKLGEKTWIRESLLKIVPEDGQVIHDDWIRYFKKIPEGFVPTGFGAGVDLAISKRETADYTAIVPGIAGLLDGKPKIYIGKRITNLRLSMAETIDACKTLANLKPGMRFFVEQVGYQAAAVEEMKRKWLAVDPLAPISDKKARLEAVAGYVRDGTVEFPDEAADDLVIQLTHFGTEAHDDLVDAFAYLLLGLLRNSIGEKKVVWL